jgi:hypothetical protein
LLVEEIHALLIPARDTAPAQLLVEGIQLLLLLVEEIHALLILAGDTVPAQLLAECIVKAVPTLPLEQGIQLLLLSCYSNRGIQLLVC